MHKFLDPNCSRCRPLRDAAEAAKKEVSKVIKSVVDQAVGG